MYDLSSLKHGIQKPILIARELNRLGHSRFKYYDKNPKGTGIFELDWDNLIILDACRYDHYHEVVDLPGDVRDRTTLAGATYEFVPANFSGKSLHDVVYVTTNSWYTRLKDDIDAEVHALIDLNHYELEPENYDPEFDIIKPAVVTEHAKRVAGKYPDKRIIVHHNQPHYPYIGEFGRKRFNMSTHKLEGAVRSGGDEAIRQDVRRAYRENIDLVLREVEELHESLVGKTVVTSDHGDMLGERHSFVPVRDYGHHDRIYNEYLTRVPWHVLPFADRKVVRADPPVMTDRPFDEQRTRDALEALGYLS